MRKNPSTTSAQKGQHHGDVQGLVWLLLSVSGQHACHLRDPGDDQHEQRSSFRDHGWRSCGAEQVGTFRARASQGARAFPLCCEEAAMHNMSKFDADLAGSDIRIRCPHCGLKRSPKYPNGRSYIETVYGPFGKDFTCTRDWR